MLARRKSEPEKLANFNCTRYVAIKRQQISIKPAAIQICIVPPKLLVGHLFRRASIYLSRGKRRRDVITYTRAQN